MPERRINIQICFAGADRVLLKALTVDAGTTLGQALALSGVSKEAGVDLSTGLSADHSSYRTGIYGKLKSADTVLRDRDRVEIYRPLRADPKEARRRRAKKKAA